MGLRLGLGRESSSPPVQGVEGQHEETGILRVVCVVAGLPDSVQYLHVRGRGGDRVLQGVDVHPGDQESGSMGFSRHLKGLPSHSDQSKQVSMEQRLEFVVALDEGARARERPGAR